MPEFVYSSEESFEEVDSSALVIACSGHAWLPYVREFLAKLGLPEGRYDLLAVPGGPQFLLLTEYLPKFAWVGQRWVKFLSARHQLKRIIAISHEDCAWYSDERLIPAFLQKYGRLERSLKEQQQEDLRAIAEALHSLLPAMAIEAYYASKGTDGHVQFLRVV